MKPVKEPERLTVSIFLLHLLQIWFWLSFADELETRAFCSLEFSVSQTQWIDANKRLVSVASTGTSVSLGR